MGALFSALPLLAQLLDKILPDKDAADAAKLELVKLAQQGDQVILQADVAIATAQSETNKIEAASNRFFVAGWRPACGWICVMAIGFKFIGGPLLVMAAALAGVDVDLPDIDAAELMPLLLGMLGLGALRTVEKIKGAA